MPPNAMKLVRTVMKPSNGARTRRLSMLRSATVTESCALFRFSRRPSAEARLVSRCVFTSDSSWARRCFASSSASTFCCALIALTSSLLCTSSSARRPPRLRVACDDVLLGEPQIESRLLEVELLVGAVELHDDVAGLQRVAG